MAVPSLHTFPAATINLDPSVQMQLPVMAWMQQFVANDVPGDALPWMLAQGWQISGIQNDNSTTPPTPYYTLTRQGMTNAAVLQSLVNTYTDAYNEGRFKNASRYDNIVNNWASLIGATIADLDSAANNSNVASAAYIGELSTSMALVDNVISANDTAVQQNAAQLDASLQTYLGGLTALENNYASAAPNIASIIADETSLLASFTAKYEVALSQLAADFNAQSPLVRAIEGAAVGQLSTMSASYQSQLDNLMTQYTAFAATVNGLIGQATATFTIYNSDLNTLLGSILADYTAQESTINGILTQADSIYTGHQTYYQGVLALLLSDWAAHSGTTTALLQGLGTQEIVRINEQWDARKAAAQQELVDRGMFSSLEIVPTLAQVERERNMALTDLNDRLNREKVENDHKLYEQEVGVRSKTLDGMDRLYTLDKEVLQYKAESMTRLYGELEDTRNRTLTAKQTLYSLNKDLTAFQTDVQNILYGKVQEVKVRVLEGTERLYQIRNAMQQWLLDDQHKLYQEQVAELFKFLEGTEIEQRTQQEVDAKKSAQYDRLLSQLQDASAKVIDGRARGSQLQIANAEFLIGARERLAALSMQSTMNKVRTKMEQNAQDMALIKYQIDAQNNLIVGLFAFEERRNDTYPSLEILAQLCSQLGDSSSTSWVSP